MSTDGRLERGRVSTDVTLVYEDGTQDGTQDGWYSVDKDDWIEGNVPRLRSISWEV